MTENYLIVAEGPLVVNPLQLAMANKPFIENYRWEPGRNGRFYVMHKADGQVVRTYKCKPFFTFHHINAYETDGEIIVDLSGYDDAALIHELYLKNLRGESGGRLTPGQFRRYHLPEQGDTADYELMSDEGIELPRIHYGRCNGRDYQFAYGGSYRKDKPDDFINQLVKVDVKKRQTKTWYEEDCYPGEPVFVADPQTMAEDEGVILSVVLDGNSGTSFLLVLDAASFGEIGRAAVPHHVPFGFHGQYFKV
jgi:carotenoid cleavage dioxygenase-like enzyme